MQYVIATKSKLIKQREANGLSNSLDIKTPFKKIHLVGSLVLEILVNKLIHFSKLIQDIK